MVMICFSNISIWSEKFMLLKFFIKFVRRLIICILEILRLSYRKYKRGETHGMHSEDRNTRDILDGKTGDNKTIRPRADVMIILKCNLRKQYLVIWIWIRILFSCLFVHCTSLPDSVKAFRFLTILASIRFSTSPPSLWHKKRGLLSSHSFILLLFSPTHYTTVDLVRDRKLQTQINKKQSKQTKRKPGNSKVKGKCIWLFLLFFVVFFLSFLSASSLTCHRLRKEPHILLNSPFFSSKVFGHGGLV
jgi:hypothetical protein